LPDDGEGGAIRAYMLVMLCPADITGQAVTIKNVIVASFIVPFSV
jgi:hypothetical protein